MIDSQKIQEDIDVILITKNYLKKEYFDLREKYRAEEEKLFILKDLSQQLEAIKLNNIIERNTIYEIDGESEINYVYGSMDVDPNGEDEPYLHYLVWRKRRLEEAATLHIEVLKELKSISKKDISSNNKKLVSAPNDITKGSFNDLKKELNSTIQNEIKTLKENLDQNKNSKFLQRKEVLQMLGISNPTLIRWVKEGIIVKYKVGSRVYFIQDEIESIILNNSSLK